jgi:acetylornithine deacetylase/succinyl-diaminopimelate desuccinylase-like protein
MIKNCLVDLKSWYHQHSKQTIGDFFTFLSFSSISTDPNYKEDILSTANWLSSYLKNIGMNVELWDTSGHPVIFATHLEAGPSRPTILIYHHYDVQPVDPYDKWRSQPFNPMIKDNKVYARGASDNKGQCFYTITALKAFLQLSKQVGVNIKLFIEGEEECGSKGTTEILEKRKKELKADHLLIVDMGLPQAGIPAITLGLRGITTMQVVLRNSKADLHSGIYGGIVLNPNQALISLLSKLWDKSGKVAVPGFYDDVIMPSKEELDQIDQTIESEESLQKNYGILAFKKSLPASLWESNTIWPTLEINGISGGYAGKGFKTVIPSSAIAKISCRLVPNQDPDDIAEKVIKFLKDKVDKGIEIQADFDHGGLPVRTSPTTPIAQIATEAFEQVFKKPCQKIFCGASVPIVADLTRACGAQVAMIGVALMEDEMHAPNENFGLDRFEQGFLVMGSILHKLSEKHWPDSVKPKGRKKALSRV